MLLLKAHIHIIYTHFFVASSSFTRIFEDDFFLINKI
jgi:hypothetical protein